MRCGALGYDVSTLRLRVIPIGGDGQNLAGEDQVNVVDDVGVRSCDCLVAACNAELCSDQREGVTGNRRCRCLLQPWELQRVLLREPQLPVLLQELLRVPQLLAGAAGAAGAAAGCLLRVASRTAGAACAAGAV